MRTSRAERRGRSGDEKRTSLPHRSRLPVPSATKSAALLSVNPTQPLAAFEGDEQLILENFFRKHDPKKTSKEIATLRKKNRDFRGLCTRLAQLHGDPDPLTMWKQPMHGHKPSRGGQDAKARNAASYPASIPYSMPARSGTLQEAAQAAGKKMSKAVALELRVEEAKKQIRRASYDPSMRSRAAIDRRAIDDELRDNGFDGIHNATPEQIKEAKLRLTLRTNATGAETTIWGEENMRKLNTKYRRRDLDAPLEFEMFLEALRRFGKVTKKMMQEDEARIVFERIDTDGDDMVSPEECQEFVDSPPAPRLQDWLKSAGGGSLQKVQKVSSSNAQLGKVPLGDEAWMFVANKQLAQGPPVRVSELDEREKSKHWKDCDFNTSGKASLAELQKGILQFPPDGWTGFDSKPAIALAYKQADTDWSGYIVRDEFDSYLKHLVFYTVLWKRFAEHDVDEDGRLSATEFTEHCHDLDLDMRGSDAASYFAEIDRDHSGAIDFAEFCQFISDCAGIDSWTWQQVVEWALDTQSDPTTPLSECVVSTCDSRELDELWALWDVKNLNALASGQVWEAFCRDPPLDWYGLDNQQAFNLAFSASVGNSSGGLMKRDRLTVFLKSLIYFHVLWDALERTDASFAVWMAQTQLKEISFDEIVEWFEEHRIAQPSSGGRGRSRRRVQIRPSRAQLTTIMDDRRRMYDRRSETRVATVRTASPRRAVSPRGHSAVHRRTQRIIVLQKTRAYGLGIVCSSDCTITGFRGRSAEDAGVPLGAELVSVNGVQLNADLGLLQDVVQRVNVGEEVELIFAEDGFVEHSVRGRQVAGRVSPSARARSISPSRRVAVRSASPRTQAHRVRSEEVEDELNSRLNVPYEESDWGEAWSNGALQTRDIEGEELFNNLVEELRADGVVSAPVERRGGRSARRGEREDDEEESLGFEDHHFPATDSSIYAGRHRQIKGWAGPSAGRSVEWKRPYDIDGAVLYYRGDEMAPEDVEPDDFDNSYFLAAISMLATQCRNTAGSRSGAQSGALIRDLIIDSGEDQGVFGIKFFVNGTWRTVVIDDLIPCTETSSDVWTPCFARAQRGRDRTVLWPFLFLKAWAKLHGSYEATAGGYADDALNYLTGGLCTPISLKPDSAAGGGRSPRSPRSPRRHSKDVDPWEDLVDATADTVDQDFPVFVVATLRPPASRGSSSSSAGEAEIEELGLEMGQVYEVICVAELDGSSSGRSSRKDQRLVCLWSPWSTTDYSGDYCVRSEEYRRAKSDLQRFSDSAAEPLLGGGFAAHHTTDAMMWIPFEEFARVFSEVGVCDPWTAGCINPIAARRVQTAGGVVVERQDSTLEVNLQAVHGDWVAGVSAGGTAEDETFEHNPTYEIICDGDYAAISMFQRDPRGSDGTQRSKAECAPMSLYLVTERSSSRGESEPEEQELIKLTASHHRQAARTIPLAPGCRRWLVAAADAPGLAGEFWITASAQNCRLIESTPARPNREAADAMRGDRSSRHRR